LYAEGLLKIQESFLIFKKNLPIAYSSFGFTLDFYLSPTPLHFMERGKG
jgi:hypothetical protein